jgi:hypothetical protein
MRFDPEKIAYLEQLRWWDWPKEKIVQNLDLLLNPPKDN